MDDYLLKARAAVWGHAPQPVARFR